MSNNTYSYPPKDGATLPAFLLVVCVAALFGWAAYVALITEESLPITTRTTGAAQQ
jgi:hypothetical protein